MRIERVKFALRVAVIAVVVAAALFAGGYFVGGRMAGRAQVMGTSHVTSDVEMSGTLDVASTLEFGSNDLYPVGYASSGQQLVYGTDAVTDTLTVSHGLSTVTFCVATLGADVDTDAGDPVVVTTSVSGNNCTIKAWQDDWSAAATSENVHWLVVGAP